MPAKPPYGKSVDIGDILEVTDQIGLDLIREGAAELKLDGPVGKAYQLTGMSTRDFEALERKILGKPDPNAPEPTRRLSREEKDAFLASTLR